MKKQTLLCTIAAIFITSAYSREMETVELSHKSTHKMTLRKGGGTLSVHPPSQKRRKTEQSKVVPVQFVKPTEDIEVPQIFDVASIVKPITVDDQDQAIRKAAHDISIKITPENFKILSYCLENKEVLAVRLFQVLEDQSAEKQKKAHYIFNFLNYTPKKVYEFIQKMFALDAEYAKRTFTFGFSTQKYSFYDLLLSRISLDTLMRLHQSNLQKAQQRLSLPNALNPATVPVQAATSPFSFSVIRPPVGSTTAAPHQSQLLSSSNTPSSTQQTPMHPVAPVIRPPVEMSTQSMITSIQNLLFPEVLQGGGTIFQELTPERLQSIKTFSQSQEVLLEGLLFTSFCDIFFNKSVTLENFEQKLFEAMQLKSKQVSIQKIIYEPDQNRAAYSQLYS